jgi:hypothetical protein
MSGADGLRGVTQAPRVGGCRIGKTGQLQAALAWLMQRKCIVMKTAVVVILVGFVLSSSAHAILRPRFPHRTLPPLGGYNGMSIIDTSAPTPRLPPR